MILELHPDLHQLDRRSLEDTGQYLGAMGVTERDCAIVTMTSGETDAWLEIRYEPSTPSSEEAGSMDPLDAHVTLRNTPTALAFVCKLFEAQCAAVALTTTDLRRRVEAIGPHDTAAEVSARLGLDEAKFARPDVGSWAEGSFVSPEPPGYAAYYVDIRGGLSIQARAQTAAPVIVFHAASEVFGTQRLLDKMLAFRKAQAGGDPVPRRGRRPSLSPPWLRLWR